MEKTKKGAGSFAISCFVIHGSRFIQCASCWVIKVSFTHNIQLELVDIQMDENSDSSELQTSSNDFFDKTKSEPDAQKQENTKRDAQITPTEKVFPPNHHDRNEHRVKASEAPQL